MSPLAPGLHLALRSLPGDASAALLARGRELVAQLEAQRRGVFTYAADTRPGPPAFVFDIDGVLIRGQQVLPGARQALDKLYRADGEVPRYPVAFLTNGGGVSEERKAEQLSEWLGVHVRGSQVVLSHTPFKQLVPQLGDRPVLVSGRGHVQDVARRYGFKRTVTCKQIARLMPSAVPFAHDADELRDASSPRYLRHDHTIGTETDPIAAILLFHDPSDWYKELQIMMDVLVSRGVPGRLHPPPDAPDVQVFFSNPDLLWANEFPTPRFGQGAFAACLEALHEKMTGKSPLKKVFGKPNSEPYTLIEDLLIKQAEELRLELPPAGNGSSSGEEGSDLPFSSIYAVGDNPAADVRGANRAGHPWVSVLVRTGVFSGPYANCPNDPAHLVVDDVAAAVEAALHRHRSARWHSMR